MLFASRHKLYYEQPDCREYYEKEGYDVLLTAIKESKKIEGLGCEIGVREGHGSYLMMKYGPPSRIHVAVDPYGNIEYKSWEIRRDRLNNYNNEMFYNTMINLYDSALYAFPEQRHILFFPLEDTEFMQKFKEGIPVYQYEKRIYKEYAIVHIDGPHTVEDVQKENQFFLPRMALGGIIIYDDIQQYDHFGKIHPEILQYGFKEIVKSDKKIAYKRMN